MLGFYLGKVGLVRNATLTLYTLSLVALTVPATASVIFDNYPINGTINALAMSGLFEGAPISTSASFTLGSAYTVNGVNFGVWLNPSMSFSQVDWSITSGPLGAGTLYGSDAGATVSTTAIPEPNIDFTLASATFSFPDLSLAAGTYYLTLHGSAFWDINNAAGIDAWETGFGDLSAPGVCSDITQGAASGTCAESFQILGSTPEPSAWTLLGSAIILAALTLCRKTIYRQAAAFTWCEAVAANSGGRERYSMFDRLRRLLRKGPVAG
jgi:hypothetical protein